MLPPGPRSALSQLGSLNDPLPLMRELGQRWGDTFTCPMLVGPPIVLTASPAGIRTLFTADPASFEPGTSEALAVIVGRGSLFMKSGEAHKRARKLVLPPFHGERMRAYGDTMQEAARRWLATVPVGEVRPILPVAQGITLDIIIEAIFGERDPERVQALHHDILAVVEAFNPVIATFPAAQREFWGFGPWARFKRKAEAIDARMSALVAEKRAAPGQDILSLLVAARYDDGEPLAEREILDQLLTFVVAGHETTATSLSWAMYELLRAPTWVERLREELAPLESPEAVAKAPLLDAVVNESLRMHPPVPMVTRKLVAPLSLEGFELPPGTLVAASIYGAHCRAETFPEPMAFQPERFLGRTYTPFEFIPFGGGARRCVGAAFAAYELRVALAELIRGADWALAEKGPVPNALRIGTFGPKTGVRLKRL